MIILSNKFYSFLALLFVVLIAFGYQIVTSLFLPVVSDESAVSTTVTYPYRALMLLLALMLIVSKPNRPQRFVYNRATTVFIVFFIIYFLKILIDLFYRDVYVEPDWRHTTIQYIFLSVLPSMWATIKCGRYIDYDRLNKWLVWCSVALLVILVVNQNSLLQYEYDESNRMDANVAMGSLSLGYTSCAIFYISLAWFLYFEKRLVWKSFLVLMMVASFVIMLRAASRGPIMAFVILLLLMLYSRFKNKNVAIIISIIAVIVLWLNLDAIINFMGEISPMMEQRMSASANEGDSSGRDYLFASAIDVFMRNPAFGEKFVIDIGYYSHNSLLDVMMALGILGGLTWIYLMIKDIQATNRNVLSQSPLMIVGFLSVNEIVEHMFSGTIYTSSRTIALMVIVLMLQKTLTSQTDQPSSLIENDKQ